MDTLMTPAEREPLGVIDGRVGLANGRERGRDLEAESTRSIRLGGDLLDPAVFGMRKEIRPRPGS
jgi:hypothetical protein